MLQDVGKGDDKARTFALPDNSDELDRLKKLTEASLTPLIEDKYIDENTLFGDKQVLKKVNPKYMTKIIDNGEKYKRNKKFYEDESKREHAKTKFFDNPTMSTKKINIITQLKELYELRGQYFTNKFNNEPDKNKFIDIRSIDNNIYRLEYELRDQKGSSVFTYQNDFVKLLILLKQLLTKTSSKEFKNDTSKLLKNLYNSRRVTKQVYNNLIKVDLLKYEYLTKKDLGYKPDAFEQARFEYSPLDKVFIDGLDKSDRKEGLSKRLKNIEDKNNNQLLALNNIIRPSIKGKNGSDNDDNDNDDVNDEYKSIQNFKQELIDKNILRKDGIKKFDNIVNKWKQTKDKKNIYKNVDTKVDTKKFNIYKIFENYLTKSIDYDRISMIEKSIKDGIKTYKKRPRTDKNKKIINNSNKIINAIKLFKSMIDNNEFKISGEYNAKPNYNIDLDWMIDKDVHEETAEEAGSDYMKGKGFITKINNGTINNKNEVRNEFRKLKQKVTNDILRQDLIKDLERYLFGEDIESIKPEKEYEESIAERIETRRQNKENNKDTQRTFAPQDSSINLDNFTYGENYDELDGEDREILKNYEGRGLKILSKQQMLSRLPILLAQIQAGNNSKKLKNETKQILYSLYRSKALTKTVYNNLIKAIRA